jgi:hypothetical protein
MMTTQFVWGTVTFAGSVILYDPICHGRRGWKSPAIFAFVYGIYLLLGGGYMGGAAIAMTACTIAVALYRMKFTRELAVSYAVRIPTKPAMHSNMKPATYSDLMPATIPI